MRPAHAHSTARGGLSTARHRRPSSDSSSRRIGRVAGRNPGMLAGGRSRCAWSREGAPRRRTGRSGRRRRVPRQSSASRSPGSGPRWGAGRPAGTARGVRSAPDAMATPAESSRSAQLAGVLGRHQRGVRLPEPQASEQVQRRRESVAVEHAVRRHGGHGALRRLGDPRGDDRVGQEPRRPRGRAGRARRASRSTPPARRRHRAPRTRTAPPPFRRPPGPAPPGGRAGIGPGAGAWPPRASRCADARAAALRDERRPPDPFGRHAQPFPGGRVQRAADLERHDQIGHRRRPEHHAGHRPATRRDRAPARPPRSRRAAGPARPCRGRRPRRPGARRARRGTRQPARGMRR